MSSPTGPDENHPEGGAPQGQPGFGAPPPPPAGYGPAGYGPSPYGTPGYDPAPAYSGGPAPTGQRPTQVQAAAIIGIVWGALGLLLGILGLIGASAVDSLGLDVEISGIDIVLGILGLVAAGVLLLGGIQVVQGKSPKLLLYAAYAHVALWVLGVIANLVQGRGLALISGILGALVAGVVIFLLRQTQSKQYYASRGIGY